MLAVRIFLALSAVLWLPYGVQCLLDPSVLAAAAGVTAASATGTTELRAMYGGLQIALGLLALAGAVRPALAQHALVALGVVSAGLGIARLGAAVISGEFASYTLMALALEFTLAIAVLVLWRRAEPAAA
jgi:hypothetical protein